MNDRCLASRGRSPSRILSSGKKIPQRCRKSCHPFLDPRLLPKEVPSVDAEFPDSRTDLHTSHGTCIPNSAWVECFQNHSHCERGVLVVLLCTAPSTDTYQQTPTWITSAYLPSPLPSTNHRGLLLDPPACPHTLASVFSYTGLSV